jgi:phage recombination protein Bet
LTTTKKETMTLPATRSTALPALVTRLAGHFEMVNVDPQELITTLKATAFKVPGGGEVTDAQMTALLIVANQYKLNPWTKEIYAFPAKGGGIVPIVGVDGWLNIINNHPQFDGMEFEYDHGDVGANGKVKPVSVTCIIHRKDRTKPVKITEFYDECYRNTEPWNQMGKRMLRNKAIIQCGRVAFSYGGIHDPDEGADILGNEKFMGPADEIPPGTTGNGAAATTQAGDGKQTLPTLNKESFEEKLPTWRGMIASGQKPADRMVSFLKSKYTLTADQEAAIRKIDTNGATDVEVKPTPAPKVTYAEVIGKMNDAAKAQNRDAFDTAATLIAAIGDEQQRVEATQHYEALLEEFA